MIYSNKQLIRASMTDTKANLSILGTYQIIQDAITELMGKLKIDGFTVKEKYNAFWVFTKTRVRFIKKVNWNDEITISSFISSISAARINVDVEVKDKFGDIAFHSRTEICAININTQRIIKLSLLGVDSTMLENKQLLDIVFTRFEENDLPLIDKVKIKYTNIDFSHHTNNLEYIRIIMNTYSVAQVENKAIKEMEIIYSNQSFENDVLDIRKANFENKDLIILEKNSLPVVKCEISF